MLLDDQFIVVKMLNESLGENQIVSSGRHELEKIAFEQLGVGYAVKTQVLPDIRHFIGVINAGDAISEFLGKVNHVVARYATDLDCLSAPGLCQEPREYRMMLEDRALIALPRWQIPPRRIQKFPPRRIRHKYLDFLLVSPALVRGTSLQILPWLESGVRLSTVPRERDLHRDLPRREN